MRADLGLDVNDDAQGCLQDIHWSFGAIGCERRRTAPSLRPTAEQS